ncbi:carbohydrate kinase family protein [Patescibacteria group bacterium]|nr:carbohydrate kinase family protein [Patescibacteria group bacterium]MBU1663273.1 carbohydrate kinase family protein [Patescibacteria group bacterium]MBU1933867.1 carbohydrate kinase family protein [Patescibacteria group bacterium]MBU2007989.1 carbohydrate kinase family protein [Patescibacteria group bacterium]MBU2233566.1 carbohydrate kinase family protein [Patescibacteria group bacterium]
MKNNILVYGSLAYDRIMDFPGYFKNHILPDKIHNLNVSFNVNGLTTNFGGTAGNIAYNLSLISQPSTILSLAGYDFGDYEKWLKKNKINTTQIKKVKTQTASAYIITDKADNQIAGFNPGAMAQSLGKLTINILSDCFIIISSGYYKEMERLANYFIKQKIKYIFDPGQQITNLPAKAIISGIAGAQVLIGNDYEIEMIKQKIKWTSKKLIDKVKTLIITKGANGSEIYNQGKKIIILSAKAKSVVDPTGAGDGYRAGIIKGMLENWNWLKTGRFASAIAVYAVEKYGTQKHAFGWKELRKRYEDNYGERL